MPAIPKRLDPLHLGRMLTREESLELRARTMTERQLEDTVAAMARARGWRRYHTHRSDRSPAGFPDDVLVRDGRLLFLELKTEAGKLSAEQSAWIADLTAVAEFAEGAENAAARADGYDPPTLPLIVVTVVRPSDLLAGRLEELLR